MKKTSATIGFTDGGDEILMVKEKISNMVRWSVVGLTAWAAVALLLPAQIRSTGGISGIVEDSTGGVLPGVTVTAVSVERGTRHSALTDEGGRYRILQLQPGSYDVHAELPGFRAKIHNGVVVTVGRNRVVDFQLEVGEITEEVTVEGGAPLVELSSSTLSSLVSAEAIHELPLNGRSFDQLITLSAGTVNYRNREANAARGTASTFSAAGVRASGTKLVIDGAEYSGATAINNAVSSASGNLLGVDGIQEFAVTTHTADASHGKRNGAQVSIVTRSGGNEFHGTAFEFVRDETFDARNFFDRERPSLRRHNFGFSIGGPIARNKTFFFGNYERLTEDRGVTLRALVPDADVRNGVFPDGTVIPVEPSVQPILDLYPPANGRVFGDGTAESINTATDTIRQTFAVVRIDHNLSPNDLIFGRYWIDDGSRLVNNDEYGLFPESNPFRTQLFTLGYRKVFSSRLVNEANFSFNRSRLFIDFVPNEGVTIPDELILVPGETQQGGVRVGVSSGGASTQLPTLGGRGSTGTAERFFARNAFEYSDQMNYTSGAHSLKFGFEVQRIQHNEFSGTQTRGFLEFRTLQDLLQANTRRIRGPLPGSDAIKGWRQTFFGLYIHDDWQLTRDFTFNIGLRWELMSNPTEVNGKISRFGPPGGHIGLPVIDEPIVVDHVFAENTSGNWAPRIGFAWDLFGNGRTALRSGFGLYYSQITSEFRRKLGAAAPFFNRVTVRNPPFPDPGQALGEGSPGRLNPTSVHPSPGIPTSIQYNLSLEHQLAAETVLSVTYAGSRGYHLARDVNPQIPAPFVNAAGRLAFPQAVLNPSLSDGDLVLWDTLSFYNSLQVEFERRFSQGLRFKSAFTWSKAIDEGVDVNSSPTGLDDQSLVPTDHRFDRSLAPFHVGRQLVVNWSWEIPRTDYRGVAGGLLNGWQLLGIVQVADGSPFTAVSGFEQSFQPGGIEDSERPDLVGPSNNPVLGGPDQYYDPLAFELQPEGVLGTLGKNTLIGPGFATVDFSVFKNFNVTEGSRLQFRAEFFNLLNRANFALPDNSLFQPDGDRRGAAGRITNTLTTGREVQFALKFIF